MVVEGATEGERTEVLTLIVRCGKGLYGWKINCGGTKVELNIEVVINKLEYKVNELIIRNAEIERLGAIKDRREVTYRCELSKELLSLLLNKIKISIIGDIARGDEKIAKLRLNGNLAKNRFYSMKSSIENIKLEIEILRSILTWFRVEFQCS